MCGIVGFVGQPHEGQWNETHRILTALFLASESRRRDATGFVAQTQPLDGPRNGSLVLAKESITASEFVESNARWRRLRHQRSAAVVGHVREATHGKPEEDRNNHPFISDLRKLFLVHNGVLTNHGELADRHALHLESDCDSEVLLRMVEAARHPAVGLQQCLREAEGSMAVSVLDAKAHLVWLARNRGRPLWLARLRRDRRLFFASTGTILLTALGQVLGADRAKRLDYFAPVPEHTPLAISPDGRIIAPLAE